MDVRNVAEKHSDSKENRIFGVPLERRQIAPALLAMHRWGVVTAEQFVRLTGYSHHYATKKLLPRLSAGGPKAILRAIRPTTPRLGPPPPNFYALAKSGYDKLCHMAEAEWNEEPEIALGRFVPPVESIFYDEMAPHRVATIDALCAAERDAPSSMDETSIVDMIAEFRFWNGLRYPTALRNEAGRRFKADAVIALGKGQSSWIDMIEVDMGSETVSPENPMKLWGSIEGKFKNYWSVLGAAMIRERFGVTSPYFRVQVVTTCDRRIDTMIETLDDSGLLPIDGLLPQHVFMFTTMERAIESYYGQHWRTVGRDSFSPVTEAANAA